MSRSTSPPAESGRRLAIVQFGSFAEAARRFEAGDRTETYYGQRYTLEHVAAWAAELEAVSVISLASDEAPERLSMGVATEGVELYPARGRSRERAVLAALDRAAPSDVIMATPNARLLAGSLARGCRLLPLFADSFQGGCLRQRIRQWRLVRILRDERVRWVANHNLAASLDLTRIGVPAHKVLPFDWPPLISPESWPPRSSPERGGALRVLYVGQLIASKGVGDAIEAVAELQRRGVEASLDLIGLGDEHAFRAQAESLGIQAAVAFLGRLAHADVLEQMSRHDVVVVPSRHDYPEGLPATLYEALCCRTPLVISDHPMFRLRLRPEVDALAFPAGRPVELARQLERLSIDPGLYARLSREAAAAAERYLCPLKWHELIQRWLRDAPEDAETLASYSLDSGRYDAPAP